MDAGKLFNSHSEIYKKFRPVYPQALYDKLESFCRTHGGTFESAVDAACGTGQATVPLSRMFQSVVAVDSSQGQLSQGFKDASNVHFHCLCVEEIRQKQIIPDRSVDAIVVAQALHWFDTDSFYQDAHALLKPGKGVLAIWGYALNTMQTNEATDVVKWFHTDMLGPFWDDRRKILDGGYASCPPPSSLFHPIERVPDCAIEWRGVSLDNYINYLQTWSSYQTYLRADPKENSDKAHVMEQLQGRDLIDVCRDKLAAALPDPNSLTITWPMPVIFAVAK